MTELGNRLKESREEKNYSLDDLQRITKIQKRYLIGIEEGNFDVMPDKFYVRAFIKQYAESVGLNADELFEEFKSEIPTTYNEQLPEKLSRVRTRKQLSPKRSKILDLVPILLLVLFIVSGVFAVWLFLQNGDFAEKPNSNSKANETEFEESTDAPPQKTGEGEEDEEEDSKTEDEDPNEVVNEQPESVQLLVQKAKGTSTATYELSQTDKFMAEVSIRNEGESWIDIKNVNGNQFFYNMMSNGQKEQFDFSKETQIVFNIGRTIDTEIKINGEVFEFPFDPNQVVTQRITIVFNPSTAE